MLLSYLDELNVKIALEIKKREYLNIDDDRHYYMKNYKVPVYEFNKEKIVYFGKYDYGLYCVYNIERKYVSLINKTILDNLTIIKYIEFKDYMYMLKDISNSCYYMSLYNQKQIEIIVFKRFSHWIEHSYKESKVKIIQKYWKEVISNPSYVLCQKRLLYEFDILKY